MRIVNEALSRIHSIVEEKGCYVLYTDEIARKDRELLVSNGWLKEIIRGWYLVVRPDLAPGDSTAWYANFWNFLRVYTIMVQNIAFRLSLPLISI